MAVPKFTPAYQRLLAGELAYLAEAASARMEGCDLCARHCGVNRLACHAPRYLELNCRLTQAEDQAAVRVAEEAGLQRLDERRAFTFLPR